MLLRVLGSAAFVTLVVATLPFVSEAQSREPTAEEKEYLSYLGYTGGQIDNTLYETLRKGCDVNAYQVLETKYKGSSNIQITPKIAGTQLRDGIDAGLACRLVKLFDAAVQRGCTVKLSSGYRSAELQRSMCGDVGRSGCATPGRSCHQYGLAVDVTGSCVGWLRMVAPQFKLVFPYYGDHIQCAEHPVAACSSSTSPCGGGAGISPDLTRFPSPQQVPETYFVPPSGAGAAPNSGLSNQLRSLLGMPQLPPPPPPPPPPLQQTPPLQQQLPQSQQDPLQNIFQPTTNPSSTPISNLFTPIDLGPSSSSSPSTGTSTLDLLNAIGNPFEPTTTEIGTSSSPVSLILAAIQDIATIGTGTTSTTTLVNASGTKVSQQPLNAPQTFTSPDLSGVNTYGSGVTSTFGYVLEEAKKVLLRLLQILRPFGGLPQPETDSVE